MSSKIHFLKKSVKLLNKKFVRVGKYKFFAKYIFIIAIILVISNYGIYIVIRQLLYSQTCFTRQHVSSDSRCLYILNSKVFEKGTRSKPHQGHPCGMDVTSIIPGFHLADVAKHLDPNYKGTI